jgi:MOSC domain-containing protein
VPTVSRLCVTPVKGLRLREQTEIELTAQGVVDNRRFFLVSESGRLFSGLHHGPLCLVEATYDAAQERLALRFPDGSVVEGSAIAEGEAAETDFWGHHRVKGRAVVGPFAAALSAYAGTELRLMRPDRPGDGCDIEPVTLLSDASVEELRRRAAGDDELDGRRFRMLVHLDGCEPHEEDTWEGRLVSLGEAVLRVGGPVPRCATTTRSPDTGLRDFDTLRQVKAYRGLREGKHVDFGVYAEVVEPGRVRVGDHAVLEGRASS